MSAVMEDTLMSHVSWGDSAFPPVSEASGYGNKVLFTPVSASQGWCRWPAPTRLQLQTTLETNPEDRAPLGWEIEFESVCCGYQASTGSDGIELRHDQLRIMSPSKSKQPERSSHVHTASVAHKSHTSNFAEANLYSTRKRVCALEPLATMSGQGKGKGLTQKQAAQVLKAPPANKKALRASFNAQNNQKLKGYNPPKPVVVRTIDKIKKRSKRAQGAGMTRRIPHFLDPLCAMPAPSVTSDGKALPHTALVSEDFVVGSTNTTLLFATNVGHSGTCGALLSVDPNGLYVPGTLKMLTIPTLAASDADGGPSAARPMKFSVSVVNCTNALKRGGRVTYLNSSQRLPGFIPGAGTEDDFTPIITGIKGSPYRRRITGDCLGVPPGGNPTQLIGFPVDSVAYSSFEPFLGTEAWSDFRRHILGAVTGYNAPVTRSMSIVVYVFDPVGDPQDYSVTIRGAYYTRWPLTSVPGQSMRNIPTANATVVNHARDHAEATANDLAHVVEGGLLATIGPRIAGAARAGVNRLGSVVADRLNSAAIGAIETVEGAATEMIGAQGATLAGEALALM